MFSIVRCLLGLFAVDINHKLHVMIAHDDCLLYMFVVLVAWICSWCNIRSHKSRNDRAVIVVEEIKEKSIRGQGIIPWFSQLQRLCINTFFKKSCEMSEHSIAQICTMFSQKWTQVKLVKNWESDNDSGQPHDLETFLVVWMIVERGREQK